MFLAEYDVLITNGEQQMTIPRPIGNGVLIYALKNLKLDFQNRTWYNMLWLVIKISIGANYTFL